MEGAQSRSAACFAVFGRVLGHLPPAGSGHASLHCSQILAWRALRAGQLVSSLSLVVSWGISRRQARVMRASIAPENHHGVRSELVSCLIRYLWSCRGASPACRLGSCQPRLLPKARMEGAQSMSAGFFAVFGRVLRHLPPTGAGHASLDCFKELEWRALRAGQLAASLSLVGSWGISHRQARVMPASIAPKSKNGGRSEHVSWFLRSLWSCLGGSPSRWSCPSLACAAMSPPRAGFSAFVLTA